VGGGCGGVCRSGARARQPIKRWSATARAGPRAFAINAGAEAQELPADRPADRHDDARASAPALMPLRVSESHPVQAPAHQQRQVTSGSLPYGPTAYTGGHARRPSASAPMQTWRKFGPGIGRVGRVGPDTSHRWEDATTCWSNRTNSDTSEHNVSAPLEMPKRPNARVRTYGIFERCPPWNFTANAFNRSKRVLW
jgi:hypothetical protein